MACQEMTQLGCLASYHPMYRGNGANVNQLPPVPLTVMVEARFDQHGDFRGLGSQVFRVENEIETCWYSRGPLAKIEAQRPKTEAPMGRG